MAYRNRRRGKAGRRKRSFRNNKKRFKANKGYLVARGGIRL